MSEDTEMFVPTEEDAGNGYILPYDSANDCWYSTEDKSIPVKELGDQHLLNIKRWLQRQLLAASSSYDAYYAEGFEAEVEEAINRMDREIKRRKLGVGG